MWNIKDIHNRSFEYLLKHHYNLLAKGSSCHFRTRLRFASKKENYWFLGNENYAAISFWTGHDITNNTPNIYVDINIGGQVCLYLTAKDNENKQNYLLTLSKRINGMVNIGNNVFRKIYATDPEEDYINTLGLFLHGDKIVIDNFFIENPYQEGLQIIVMGEDDGDFDDPKKDMSFLREADFYRMISLVLHIKNVSEDSFFNEENRPYKVMPLCIKSIEIINFKGINHIRIDNIPVDTKWIVLTGENGFGKTSILQSIAGGFIGQSEDKNILIEDSSLVIVEAKASNENFINVSVDSDIREQKGRYFNSKRQYLATYGSSRLSLTNSDENTYGASYSLFNTDGRLLNIESAFKEFHKNLEDKFNLLKSAFLKLIPDLSNISVEIIDNELIVKYIEKDAEGIQYNGVTFNQLASGFKSIIAVVGDIISRLTRSNTSYISLNSIQGIVIIDEIELHLHPKYQRYFPQILTELFPNVLFICSTHSPIPLLGMPRETVLLKVNRSKEEGITAEIIKLEVDISKLLPDSILSSPIFGFDDIFSIQLKDIEKLNTSDSYDEAKIIEDLKTKFLKIKEANKV